MCSPSPATATICTGNYMDGLGRATLVWLAGALFCGGLFGWPPVADQSLHALAIPWWPLTQELTRHVTGLHRRAPCGIADMNRR